MTDEMCKLMHEGVAKEQDRTEKRLNGHSEEIKELTQLVTELAATNAQLVKTQELLIKNLEAQEKRIKSTEDKADALAKALALPPKKTWYESDIGKFIIKAGVILIFAVVFAAIGLNAFDAAKVATGIK